MTATLTPQGLAAGSNPSAHDAEPVTVIYLDNNATTRPAPEAVAAMMPFLTGHFGNASSVHRVGQIARTAVDSARAQVAQLIGCNDGELTFTGGGTESINTIIRGLLRTRMPRNKVITSNVEHSATKELCKQLVLEGVEVVELQVDRLGRLDLDRLKALVDDSVAMVTMMWANNETGVLYPVEQIAAICRAAKVPFHCDGTQAVGKIPIAVNEMGIDAMSFASHKFHGPKGVGGMFVRRGLRIPPLLIGGPQERGRRGGTENVPGIVGMGKAAELAQAHLADMPRVSRMRDNLERGILSRIAETSVNGDTSSRLPNTTNISFARLTAEAILISLSEKGICTSAGSACSSGSLEPSHVLRAMGIEDRIAMGALRFSLSSYNTEAEIDRLLDVLPPVIERLRKVMPV